MNADGPFSSFALPPSSFLSSLTSMSSVESKLRAQGRLPPRARHRAYSSQRIFVHESHESTRIQIPFVKIREIRGCDLPSHLVIPSPLTVSPVVQCPRVRRRLFNLAAAVSLVLCIATAIAWSWIGQ